MSSPISGTVYQGDCQAVMAEWPDGCIDSIVTDPPYGLRFMGKRWDYDVPSVELWAECYRVLADGGRLLAFSGARTQHRMVCNIEDAGFCIEDCMMWLYGSGFPKHGSKLKPAYEPICVARKGSVSLLNIDAGRIATNGEVLSVPQSDPAAHHATSYKMSIDKDRLQASQRESIERTNTLGRWPANVLLDEAAAAELDRQSGELGISRGGNSTSLRSMFAPKSSAQPDGIDPGYGDSGGASRFFKTIHHEQDDLILCRANAIMAAWNPELANSVDDHSSLGRHQAASVLSDAVTSASQGAMRLSGLTGLPMNVTPMLLRRLCENAIGVILNIEQGYSFGYYPIGMARWNGGLAKSVELLKPSDITMITASPTFIDGSVVAATFDSTRNNAGDGNDDSPVRLCWCAKADSAERNAGCGGLAEQDKAQQAEGLARWHSRMANTHPTVKPVALMQYLLRLFVPAGGLVLDPFLGSGTTGVAAERDGVRWCGIELNPEYCEIARARTAQKGLFTCQT